MLNTKTILFGSVVRKKFFNFQKLYCWYVDTTFVSRSKIFSLLFLHSISYDVFLWSCIGVYHILCTVQYVKRSSIIVIVIMYLLSQHNQVFDFDRTV